MARILVVDDEIGIRELLSEILYDEGHTVELAENAAQARAARLRRRPDLVLLDIWMPDADGVSLLREWATQGLLDMPVVMMSGHATVDTAVEATRIGAIAFLEKPITLQKLLKTVATGLAYPVVPAVAMSAALSARNLPDFRTDMRTDTRAGPRADPHLPHLPPQAGNARDRLHHTAVADQPASTAKVATTVDAPPGASASTGAHSTGHSTDDASASEKPPAPAPSGPNWLGSIDLNQPLREARDTFERLYMQYHLERENYSMTRMSESTGLERTHLYRKLKQLGIESTRKKPEKSVPCPT